MGRLLIVHHTPSPAMQAMFESVVAGAGTDEVDGVEVVIRPALTAAAADVLEADGYLLGTSANIGYMSGALKHFFDSTFLQIGGALDAGGGGAASTAGSRKPYGLWVHGRYDTSGAVRSVQSIVQALPWTQAAPVLEVMGDVDQPALDQAYELGATLSALIAD